MIRQTLAIFLDAYRELNARKLFWITLSISMLVAGSFALVGIRGDRLVLIVWEVPLPPGSGFLVSKDLFYKMLFMGLGVTFWLSWIAVILGLVSVSSIFPDLTAGGAVDLVLSKPIGRLRLFLTKYAAGLLFVALQVALFSLASYLVIGFRGGTWEPGIFLAVPIVLCLFSYLYAVCALLGVLTRSPVASLLLTLVAWAFFIAAGVSEKGLLMGREFMAARAEELQKSVERLETNTRAQIARAREQGQPTVADGPLPEGVADELEAANPFLRVKRSALADARRTHQRLVPAHRVVLAMTTVLPKTGETRELLNRVLVSAADLEAIRRDAERARPRFDGAEGGEEARAAIVAAERVEDASRTRPVWWVVGTSLAFEAVVLAAAAAVFVRRDF